MSRGTPRRMKMDSATLYMGRQLECAYEAGCEVVLGLVPPSL
jgi:hypothetical protein